MKKIIGVLLIFIVTAFSQDSINIHLDTGVLSFPLNRVDSISYTGFKTGTMTDQDGNVYRTVKIGNQWWMAENLRVKHYRDGSLIPNIIDDELWMNYGENKTGAYCVYDNDKSNAKTYGYLYNWYAVADSRNIAPEGWHVPTDAEWTEMENYLIANGYNGSKIGKSLAAKSGWHSYSEQGTIGNDQQSNNSTGFSALPGGYRNTNGSFYNLGNLGQFWSATESGSSDAWFRFLGYFNAGVGRRDYDGQYGFSLRLVRD